MATIAICGFYGHQNYGDSLMLKGLQDFLKSSGFYTQIISDKDSEESFKTERVNNDIIALGGGGIITENFWFFKENFPEQMIQSQKLILLNVGLTSESESILEKYKDRMSLAVVRDFFSQELAAKYLPRNKILYAPDISFLNKLPLPKKENLVSVCLNYYIFKDFFGTDIRKKVFAEKALIELAALLDWVSETYKYKIYLVPCQTSREVNDNVVNAVLNGFLNKKAEFIYDNQKLENVIARSKVLISSRYHSSLYALKSRTPFVDITHHSKNLNFLKDCGLMDFSISYWQLELNSLKEKFKKVHDYKDLAEISDKYGVECSESWNKIKQTLQAL